MRKFSLVSKANTIKELKHERATIDLTLKPISREKWFNYINDHSEFFWYIDAPLGQSDMNHKEYPLDPRLYYACAYYDFDPQKGYSDTVIEFPLHSQYIRFQFPRTNVHRLQMMWDMAEALDCYLTEGITRIITKEKFEKLIERYTPKKRGAGKDS